MIYVFNLGYKCSLEWPVTESQMDAIFTAPPVTIRMSRIGTLEALLSIVFAVPEYTPPARYLIWCACSEDHLTCSPIFTSRSVSFRLLVSRSPAHGSSTPLLLPKPH